MNTFAGAGASWAATGATGTTGATNTLIKADAANGADGAVGETSVADVAANAAGTSSAGNDANITASDNTDATAHTGADITNTVVPGAPDIGTEIDVLSAHALTAEGDDKTITTRAVVAAATDETDATNTTSIDADAITGGIVAVTANSVPDAATAIEESVASADNHGATKSTATVIAPAFNAHRGIGGPRRFVTWLGASSAIFLLNPLWFLMMCLLFVRALGEMRETTFTASERLNDAV